MVLVVFAAGLVLLVAGAELLVRGASAIAAALRVPPLVVGLTVVAFATSAPELAVTSAAALDGTADVAVGGVVGSNIFNVLLILGVSSLILPLAVTVGLVRVEIPIMIGATVLAFLVALDGRLGRLDGVILLAGMAAFLGRQWWAARAELDAEAAAEAGDAPPVSLWRQGAAVLVGLGLLVLGARWSVDAAVELAERAGISEIVVGLTLVAAGTSLPELATSAMASLRGERDIAVGNVIGSNVFNLLAVLGVGSLLAPSGLRVMSETLAVDLPVMLAAAVVCLPLALTGYRISRREGVVLLAGYVAFVVYLVLARA